MARSRAMVSSGYYVYEKIQAGSDPIGGGGFSDVYKGTMVWKNRDRQVALKYLRSSVDVAMREKESVGLCILSRYLRKATNGMPNDSQWKPHLSCAV